MGCTEAHLSTLATLRKLPALVLEDDVAPLTSEMMLPHIPDDADIVYLGVSPFGCFPWQRSYARQFGHRAIYNLTLSSVENSDWIRLHSMAGAIAILYVSPKGVEAWHKAMLTSLQRRRPFDVFTAYAMTSLNVYAPYLPIFCEAEHLQKPLKHVTSRQRLSWTTTPLKPVHEGKIVQFISNGVKLQAEATVSGNNRLEWSLIK